MPQVMLDPSSAQPSTESGQLQIMAKHTGQDIKTIERDTERDNFLGGVEGVKYGLVDKVLVSRAEIGA